MEHPERQQRLPLRDDSGVEEQPATASGVKERGAGSCGGQAWAQRHHGRERGERERGEQLSLIHISEPTRRS
eukprot:1387393-Prymnesium_polylepis.1